MDEFWLKVYSAWIWIGEHTPNVAGLLGAFVSMKFLDGSFMERLLAVFGGWMFSYYTSTFAAEYFSVPEKTSAFLLGLLGMLILSKLWHAVAEASFESIFSRFLPAARKNNVDDSK